MDRNSVIGLTLIFLILIGTIFINQPTVEEAQKLKREQDSIAALARQNTRDSIQQVETEHAALPDSVRLAQDSVMADSRFGMFAPLSVGTDGIAVIENEKVQIEISKKGGAPKRVLLKPYKRALKEGEEVKEDLILFDGEDNQLNYSFQSYDNRTIRTDELYFTPSAENIVVSGDSAILTMTAALNDQISISQVYTLSKDGFMLGYKLVTQGFDRAMSPSNRDLLAEWNLAMPMQEKSKENEKNTSTIYYQYQNGDGDNLKETSYGEEEKAEGGAMEWISFKQQFFNSTLISKGQGFEDVVMMNTELPEADYVQGAKATWYFPSSGQGSETYDMAWYFGPNHYQILKAQGYNLQRLVPLGWGIFGWVNRFVVIPVFNFLNQYISSFGLIILLLTLIIKAGLFPLVYKSYLSTAKMRVIKPEMDELKEKFGKDPQKMQAESMKLYRKAGVNPLGGCVPMLLQMPILFAMFRFFPVSFELRQQSFLWAEDLSSYDSIWTFGHIPFIDMIYGDHVSLFTLLMTVSTLIYTRMNNQISGMTGQMKYIGYIMPIIFLGFFNKYAAGLSYYYFLSNMITFGQQWAIRKLVNDDKIHGMIQENKKKPVKKSKFAERLENMAKQQQQAQQQNKKRK